MCVGVANMPPANARVVPRDYRGFEGGSPVLQDPDLSKEENSPELEKVQISTILQINASLLWSYADGHVSIQESDKPTSATCATWHGS